MATLDFQLPTDRPEPLLISIKRVGDTTERFISRNGNTVAFDEDTGIDIPYVMTITDANSFVSTKDFTLSCDRPADCQYGPLFDGDLISFSPTELTYQFHGVNVTQIRRDILLNGIIVDTKVDFPSSPIVTTTFASALANGNYVIRIQGQSCYSENPSTRDFVITDDSTELDWWPNYPRFAYDEGLDKYRIQLAVNRAGTYQVKITDSSDVVHFNEPVTISPGQLAIYGVFDPDTFDIEFGPLTATLVIDEPPAECSQGPELLTVESLSPTQTEFTFHGEGVLVIEWFIRTPADVIEHTATVAPGASRVTINHPPLSGGTHNLLIKGSSCTSEPLIVDNLDFEVDAPNLSLDDVDVTQLADGRYKLDVVFSGGVGNYTIRVRALNNNVIGSYPNTTGSPASVTLPLGTQPQTIKVAVIDINDEIDEETAVILPAPAASIQFLQADNFFTIPTKTPMPNDGSTFFIKAPTDFNWDIEASLPNGGLWDYVEKRQEKYVGGVWVEKSISGATGQNQNYSVGSSTGSERLWLPRTGTSLTIDSQNVFKTANRWRTRFIFRKGGIGGAIVATIMRDYTISAPATLSGIILYNRDLSDIGSAISEINSVGDSFAKPTPRYDLSVTGFGGVSFNQVQAYFRQKVNNSFVQRYTNAKTYGSPQTTIDPAEWSLFDGTEFANVHVSILAQEPQTWEIEFIALSGSTPVATRKAIFDFTANVTSSFINQGFERRTVAGRDYQIIRGMDFGANLLSSGNLQLYHPTTRQSINGQSTVYPWVYINHVRMNSTDLTAFKSGSGLAFPKGKHTCSIKWHSNVVANYDDVIDGGGAGNAYMLAGEQTHISYGYSGMDDYFTFTIS